MKRSCDTKRRKKNVMGKMKKHLVCVGESGNAGAKSVESRDVSKTHSWEVMSCAENAAG